MVARSVRVMVVVPVSRAAAGESTACLRGARLVRLLLPRRGRVAVASPTSASGTRNSRRGVDRLLLRVAIDRVPAGLRSLVSRRTRGIAVSALLRLSRSCQGSSRGDASISSAAAAVTAYGVVAIARRGSTRVPSGTAVIALSTGLLTGMSRC